MDVKLSRTKRPFEIKFQWSLNPVRPSNAYASIKTSYMVEVMACRQPVAKLIPEIMPNYCQWPLMNKFHWILIKKTDSFFSHKFQYVVYKPAATLFSPECVNFIVRINPACSVVIFWWLTLPGRPRRPWNSCFASCRFLNDCRLQHSPSLVVVWTVIGEWHKLVLSLVCLVDANIHKGASALPWTIGKMQCIMGSQDRC